MIYPNSCQKRNSPSPIWGKLEGGSHAHDQAYYKAEKKIVEVMKSGTTKLALITFDNFYLVGNTEGSGNDNFA